MMPLARACRVRALLAPTQLAPTLALGAIALHRINPVPTQTVHYNSSVPPPFDVVGVGLNATDTLLVVPRFPAYAGKVPFDEEIVSPGGQVASAMAACARLGLRTKYIGTI